MAPIEQDKAGLKNMISKGAFYKLYKECGDTPVNMSYGGAMGKS